MLIASLSVGKEKIMELKLNTKEKEVLKRELIEKLEAAIRAAQNAGAAQAY